MFIELIGGRAWQMTLDRFPRLSQHDFMISSNIWYLVPLTSTCNQSLALFLKTIVIFSNFNPFSGSLSRYLVSYFLGL